MTNINRRQSITWLAGSLLLVPTDGSAKQLEPSAKSVSTAEKCAVLFSGRLPPNAQHLMSEEKAGIFAAVFESPARLDSCDVDRWLCLGVKTGENTMAVQVSKDVLLQHMPCAHPVEVELQLSERLVELREQKIRGGTFQQWVWVEENWVLLKKHSSDVSCSKYFVEEYNANQSTVVLTTGRIDRDDFDSIQIVQGFTHITLASYDGNTSAV